MNLTPSEARLLALHAQGLHEPITTATGSQATLNIISRLGYVQIDTISVIERAHNHVLWSRHAAYKPATLHDLQTNDRSILEYWSHAAAYLPMNHFRYTLPMMRDYEQSRSPTWSKADKKIMRDVLKRIETEGALSSSDFEAPSDKKFGGWWEWKPAKLALERLFMSGKVVVSERRKFQKRYDLPHRVIPSSINTAMPTGKEMAAFLIRQALTAHGLASEKEIFYGRKFNKKETSAALADVVGSGEVVSLSVSGIGETFYALQSLMEEHIKPVKHRRLQLLSPFDNLVIQRNRLSAFFGFDYTIECYVPAAKRKYGYFTLPMLYGDAFVGRLDPKADRQTKTFRVQNLVLEPTLNQPPT
jgi:uncharacterized protein YcaQ